MKREAKQYETELINNVANNKSTDYTFGKMVDLYIESIEGLQSTKDTKRKVYINHCKKFYDTPISKITKASLMEWANNLKSSSLSRLTINRIIGSVCSVFGYADKIYDIKDISSIMTLKKKTSNDIKEMETWTIQEFEQFENAIDNPLYRAFFHTLFWTGARRGEILALQCDDFRKNELDINKSIKHFKNGFIPLKNANSKRTIKIDTNTIDILKELKGKYKKGFLFGGNSSLSITVVQKQFKKAIKKSGVKEIRLHDLRHSHATILINNGVNIVAVSKRLGHSDINTTLRVYTHLLQKTDEKMMETINELAKTK
ncbi:site-specific integrase [Trueperella sp. zg.1013]|nr:site-specific integrase [Trueperella sp. zg.1013]